MRSRGAIINLFGNRRSQLRRWPRLRHALRQLYLRLHVSAIMLTPDKVLCRILGKYKFYASPHDLSISPHLMSDGFWEPRTTEVIIDLMRPGMVAIDVGANLGYFTVLMAGLVGNDGHVMTFEPNPEMLSLLRGSIFINGLGGIVSVYEDPLGDANGKEVTFYIPPGHPGGAQRTNMVGDDDSFRRFRTRRLDDVPRATEAALIKIDAEGMEEAIWQGMTALIAGDRLRHIIVEFTMLAYQDPGRMIDEVVQAGFALRRIDDALGIVPITRAEIIADRGQQMLLFTR